jgi:hypothetical protein
LFFGRVEGPEMPVRWCSKVPVHTVVHFANRIGNKEQGWTRRRQEKMPRR